MWWGERGGGAIPRCHLARFLVLVLFRLSQSLVPGVLAVRETSCELYKYCVYYIWWDSFQGRNKNIFLCKAICKIHICHLRNLQFLLYILYDGNCLQCTEMSINVYVTNLVRASYCFHDAPKGLYPLFHLLLCLHLYNTICSINHASRKDKGLGNSWNALSCENVFTDPITAEKSSLMECTICDYPWGLPNYTP